MTKVLVTFASSHGATADIAHVIMKVLRYNRLTVDVVRIEEVGNLPDYDAVVLGSAIYVGEWMAEAAHFLMDNAAVLQKQHVWMFASGPTGEGNPLELLDGEVVPESLHEVMETIEPREVVVFGGKLDLRRLRHSERVIVKAAQVPKGDFRNWHAIKFWAQQIADALNTMALDKPNTVALVTEED